MLWWCNVWCSFSHRHKASFGLLLFVNMLYWAVAGSDFAVVWNIFVLFGKQVAISSWSQLNMNSDVLCAGKDFRLWCEVCRCLWLSTSTQHCWKRHYWLDAIDYNMWQQLCLESGLFLIIWCVISASDCDVHAGQPVLVWILTVEFWKVIDSWKINTE